MSIREYRPPQCNGHSRNNGGARCRNRAMPGGFVCKYHGGMAPQTMRKAKERLADLLQEAIDPDRVLIELAAIAFFDPADLFDAKGNLLAVKDWPERARRAVAGMDVVKQNMTAGDGKVDIVAKPRAWDKNKALENLAKHNNLLVERVEVTGSVDLVARLAAGRVRVANASGKR